jgi:hypothetical protein
MRGKTEELKMPETIRTRPATPEYREGWERVFGKNDPVSKGTTVHCNVSTSKVFKKAYKKYSKRLSKLKPFSPIFNEAE